VYTGSHLDAERSDTLADRPGTTHRAGGAVEGGQNPVASRLYDAAAVANYFSDSDGVVLIQEGAPRLVTQLDSLARGIDDVSEQDRGQDAAWFIRGSGAGQELQGLVDAQAGEGRGRPAARHSLRSPRVVHEWARGRFVRYLGRHDHDLTVATVAKVTMTCSIRKECNGYMDIPYERTRPRDWRIQFVIATDALCRNVRTRFQGMLALVDPSATPKNRRLDDNTFNRLTTERRAEMTEDEVPRLSGRRRHLGPVPLPSLHP
jgi:hypothetical protein